MPELTRRPGQSVRVRVTELTGRGTDPPAGRPGDLEGGPGAEDGRDREDRIAAEEPLELRVTGPTLPARRIWVTMRTPGHDFELAAGFCVHEGIATPDGVRRVAYCTDTDLAPEQEFNVVTVTLDDDAAAAAAQGARHEAHSAGSSACGVCGKDSVEAVLRVPRGPARQWPEPDPDLVRRLPGMLREQQPLFERTGGVHGAALVDADGRVLVVREDVGRHNAVDKATGARVLAGAGAGAAYLVVSGRAGFELVQKAVTAGVGSFVAVGAPTSLAVRLAEQAGLALFGFTGPQRCVRYA